jgi:DNA replication protein DnaC
MLANPNCPHCRGRGHIYILDEGLIVPTRSRVCECLSQALARIAADERLAAASIPERYADASIEAFNLRSGPIQVWDAARKAWLEQDQGEIDRRNRDAVAELCRRPLGDGETIVLTGPYGAGKTYLGCALLRAQILEHGRSGLYISSVSYLRQLRPEGAEPAAQRALRRQAIAADVLLLDDLGVEKATPAAMRELWDLIDERVANNRALIVTSNMRVADALRVNRTDEEARGLVGDDREAFEIGQRIISRLKQRTVIAWPEKTRDYREEQYHRALRSRDKSRRIDLRRELAEDSELRDTPEGGR